MKDRIFWRLIRHARERRGLSQRAVPGIPQSRLSEWESGRVPVGEDTLAKLAAAFGKTLPAFLLEELALDALAQPAALPAKPGPAKARAKKIEKIE